MKRVAEKVKDIVQVRPFTHLHDFGADAALTLEGYHFTDITADLMGKWIERISQVKPGRGAALALAGLRGVGKSHFLAVVAALVAKPELRVAIHDSYVAASAERLPRRHGSVAFVRRGTGTSLVDELKRAMAEVIGVNPGTLGDSLYDLLLKGSEHSGDSPLVVLIDTALGRESRVSRDDGPMISEIAEAADTLGIFVGVALDDDISGADGPNSSISATFTIDFLDQEHLYKIVDTHVFTKNSQQLPLLRDIYAYYREMIPGFRWSEPRFTSLYPLHPVILEMAPLIRLYIQDFALLGFASEAGVKILGRPANSLIGLDEVFDNVESKLRVESELKEAFASVEIVEQQVVAKLPVQKRLHAKLILKGLFMLSLGGQGTTAAEIAASMMIFEEHPASTPVIDVSGLLDSFAQALPSAIDRSVYGDEVKYLFRMSPKSEVIDLLAEAAQTVEDDVVWMSLCKLVSERFADVGLEDTSTKCTIEWRGGLQRGTVCWSQLTPPVNRGDFTIQLTAPGPPRLLDQGTIAWRVAELTDEEKDTIRRFHVLQNDPAVREALAETLSTTTHVHGIAAEKIWQRVFLQEGVLTADDGDYRFGDAASSSHNLSQILCPILGVIFENRFPEHPRFRSVLGPTQASDIVSAFLSGSRSGEAEIQRLAEDFAAPLGIALKDGDQFVPSAPDLLKELPAIQAAFSGLGSVGNEVVDLSDLGAKMSAPPLGLTDEAKHLILAALVGQREFEFVTSNGNRISHRSLDLQIIWDDIVGLARPLHEAFAPERLLAWAKLVTGNAGLKSIDRAEDRSLIVDSLSGWLSAWNESRVLADFEALPDESLNAQIWKTAATLKKSFGAMADVIGLLVTDDITLDQCLHAIAEHFSDSESEFEKKKGDLRILGNFTQSVTRRAFIASYLSGCERTVDAETEKARTSLLESIEPSKFWSNDGDIEGLEEFWAAFHGRYVDVYAEAHDAAMRSEDAAESLRAILASPDWAVFENLFRIPWADQRFLIRSKDLIRQIRQRRCDAKLDEILAERPYCRCSFTLSRDSQASDLPDNLRATIANGLAALEVSLKANADSIADASESDAMRASVKRIIERTDLGLASLSGQDIRLLTIAAERAADGTSFSNFGHHEVASDDDATAPSLGSRNLTAEPIEVSVSQ